MNVQDIKAGINLFAVLKNLEELVEYDTFSREKIRNKRISLQFNVKNGPRAWIWFDKGMCHAGHGKFPNPTVKLWFKSTEHLNHAFEGKGTHFFLKGFGRGSFYKKEFKELLKRHHYFFEFTKDDNPNEEYKRLHIRTAFNMALFSIAEIIKHDEQANEIASHLPNGKALINVIPEGPSVYLEVYHNRLKANFGKTEKANATMSFNSYHTAYNYLIGKQDPFNSESENEIELNGQTPIIEGINQLMERARFYLKELK